MRIWRMSMRAGNQGPSLWPQCFRQGVAAITYTPLHDIDLSKHQKGEPGHEWAQWSSSQVASLRIVAYEMKKGDMIYVKEGPRIAGKGRVTSPYQFAPDSDIVAPGSDLPWRHQVPVDWDRDFVPVDVLLGAEPRTVLPLSGDRLRKLEAALGKTSRSAEKLVALEGKRFRTETTFRQRNRGLIEAKKADSDGRCEVCGFSFTEKYRRLERDCLVAHHVTPIARRSRSSKTTLDDIALLCPNCHAAVHTEDPPIVPWQLQARVKKR